MTLKTLKRIVQEVIAATDLKQALDVIVTRCVEAVSADVGSVYLIDEARGEYLLLAVVGLDANKVNKARLKFGEGLVGLVGEREEAMNIGKATQHPHYTLIKLGGEPPYESFIGLPLIDQGELLGVLVVESKKADSFGDEELAFLVTLAVQLAPLIAQFCARGALASLQATRRRKLQTVLTGIPGASGVAIGEAVVVYPPADLDAVPDQAITDTAREIDALESALACAREEIQRLQLRAKKSLSVAEQALFDAYLRILDSRSLVNEIIAEIEGGQWAQAALKRVIKRHVLHFESLDDAYLQERAADFRDLGRRILSYLQAQQTQETQEAQKRSRPNYAKQKIILVSDEVTATAILEVPEGQLVGIISGAGSANSHVAILARGLGLPTVMGVTGTSLSALDNKELIVDGYNGEIYISPSATIKREFKSLVAEEAQLDQELARLMGLPAETEDGERVSLFINTGLAIDSALALSVGAEGVGLYRTETQFMIRADRFPSEAEQRVMYRQLLNTFSPRPVVMRTLDVGGDKELPYFPVQEDNPFLGWRGIRVTLDHPEIFLQQIRAMLTANIDLNNLSILLPMITSVSEVEDAIRLIRQGHDELLEEGCDVTMPPLGLMIEVPAAIYQAVELAKRVDFLSVGTNDLIQYLLAVDRNNPRVADLYNGLHPAVLRALASVVKDSHRVNRPVSICGEMAGDPIAVLLLLGIGFDSLSMSARALPRVKWVIRNFSRAFAKDLVKEVLKMDDPIEIRCHMEMILEDAGLAGLIRAGK